MENDRGVFWGEEMLEKFMETMEEELIAHEDEKEPWQDCTDEYLLLNAKLQLARLEVALADDNCEDIVKRCAHIANFVMFLSTMYREGYVPPYHHLDEEDSSHGFGSNWNYNYPKEET